VAFIIADRVRDTTTTTGTGDLTLSGTAPTGFRAFASVMATGDACWYCVSSSSGSEWEVGRGVLTASTTLQRETLLSSSTGAVVSFSAGTKDVYITVPAARLETTGADWATSAGYALN